MPNKAIHQLPAVSDQDPTDVLHIARDIAGTYYDRSIRRDLVAQQVYQYNTAIASADILTLNTTPVKITPGIPEKIIVPVAVLITEVGGTTDYATATQLGVCTDSLKGADGQYIIGLSIPDTSAGADKVIGLPGVATSLTGVIAWEALYLRAESTNPTAGDRDWNIRIYYTVIDA